MSFSAWCRCHELDARQRADQVLQACLRCRLRREKAATYARLYAQVEAMK